MRLVRRNAPLLLGLSLLASCGERVSSFQLSVNGFSYDSEMGGSSPSGDTGEFPESPAGPSTPGIPSNPGSSGTPDDSGTPDGSGAPDGSGTPDDSGTPNNPGNPSNGYNTLALFSFDSSARDESFYGDVEIENPSFVSDAKFGSGAMESRPQGYRVSDFPRSLQSLAFLTLDAWVKPVLGSKLKSDAVSLVRVKTDGQAGWEWSFHAEKSQSGNSCWFSFSVLGNVGGSVANEEEVTSDDVCGFVLDNKFHHVQVEWKSGNVLFFVDGKLLSSRSVLANSILFGTGAQMVVGNVTNKNNVSVVFDDLRVSRVLRNEADFPVPVSAHTAD